MCKFCDKLVHNVVTIMTSVPSTESFSEVIYVADKKYIAFERNVYQFESDDDYPISEYDYQTDMLFLSNYDGIKDVIYTCPICCSNLDKNLRNMLAKVNPSKPKTIGDLPLNKIKEICDNNPNCSHCILYHNECFFDIIPNELLNKELGD